MDTEFAKKYKNELHKELIELSDTLYNNPELSGKEYKSRDLHSTLLKKHGFVVENLTFDNMDTAFRAVYNSGKQGLTIGYLAEYDALPGVGHGCGHNMLGAVSTGAAILLSKVINKIGGKVILYGTPAEETFGGKITMINGGAFDGADVGIISHPSTENKVSGTSLAIHMYEVEFFGKSAHTAADPENGISALSAMQLVFAGINALREVITDDIRINGVILEGGQISNVIPDYTLGKFSVRAAKIKTADEISEKFYNILKGAELMTGAKVKWQKAGNSYYDMNTNKNLSDVCTKYMELMGLSDINRNKVFKASLDMGNVSYLIPSIHPFFDITKGKKVPNHSKEFADCTQSDYAREQMYKMASALALTGYEVLENHELYRDIKEEFDRTAKL